MIEMLVLSLLILTALASPGHAVLSPEGLSDAGLSQSPPGACREPTSVEKLQRGLAPKGKASTMSFDGEFICQRRIFSYGERDSYSDWVVGQVAARAADTARQAATLVQGEASLQDQLWTVEVDGGERAVQGHLRRVFLHALAGSLGSGKVARGLVAPDANIVLHVTLRPVQESDLLFQVTATSKAASVPLVWQL